MDVKLKYKDLRFCYHNGNQRLNVKHNMFYSSTFVVASSLKDSTWQEKIGLLYHRKVHKEIKKYMYLRK